MRVITYNNKKYETTIVPMTHLKYYKKFGWEPVRSSMKNDEWEYGDAPLSSSTDFDQREIFNESLEWRMKNDYTDRYRQIKNVMLKRHVLYSRDTRLLDYFLTFKRHYRITLRAEKRWRYGLGLGILSFLLFLVFLLGAILCLSFAAANVDPVDENGNSLGIIADKVIVEAKDEYGQAFTLATIANKFMSFLQIKQPDDGEQTKTAKTEEKTLPEDTVFLALFAISLLLAIVAFWYFCLICSSDDIRKRHKKVVLDVTFNAANVVRELQYAHPQLMNARQRSRYVQGKIYSAAILNAEDADNQLFF